jgi:Protein of unknown function DUF262
MNNSLVENLPDIEIVEQQIYREQRTVDYDTREFTIEIIVKKYQEGIEEESNELFVPDYQRDFVWDEERQSKFIESIILGIPIPLIFVAEDSEGRLEIVDGSQRIRTLYAFLNNELILNNLEILDKLNGFTYNTLETSRQRKFKNTPMRMIVLSENASERVKNDMFERINRGSDLLREMEKRKGIYRGAFTDFIYKLCAKNQLFLKLTPINKMLSKRQEHEELLLRFFALADLYPNYPKFVGVAKTLDQYLSQKNKESDPDELNRKYEEFTKVLEFVDKYFQFGFAKSASPGVSRIYFEAISIGVHFALKEKPNLIISKKEVNKILNSNEFKDIISAKYHTHSPKKLCQRIDFIKNSLLGM